MPEGGKKYIYNSSKNVPDVVNHGKVGNNNGSDKPDNDEGAVTEDPEFPALKLTPFCRVNADQPSKRLS